jgi:hypothetical protein
MKTIKESKAAHSNESNASSVKSKGVQSLGWIDNLLGDKKARAAAREKAAERQRRLSL